MKAFLLSRLNNFSAKPAAVVILIVLAAILHSGTSINGGFYADDYVQRAFYQGSQRLEEKGLLDGIEQHSFSAFISNQFNFFNPATDNYQALKEFGLLPWWTGEEAMLHFFRPLAGVTHYIDYRFWPDNSHLMHFISLLWYLAGLVMVYYLYRQLQVGKSIALLALLLMILDQSVFQVVTWIASRSMLMVIVIGFFTVYAYHRSLADKRWYLVALLGLLASLLSAEGAIGICAYLGAYMFTLDQRPWGRRIVHILPFALLTIGWHQAYQAAGFGAYGVDFYLDPAREPATFFERALYRLPGNFFELASGVDFFSGQVRPDIRDGYFAVLGVLSFAGFLWLLWPQLKADRTLRFFLVGSCFALVPGLTIALAPRVMILPNIGFAVVLATVMVSSMKKLYHGGKGFFAGAVFYYAVLMHIVMAAGLAVYMTGNMVQSAIQEEAPRGHVELGVDDYAGKRLVIVNSLKPFWLAFVGHQLDYNDQALPQSLRVLSSSYYPLTLTRQSENTLVLEGHPALQLDSEPVTDLTGKPALHFIYLTQQLMGLVRAQRDAWQAGSDYAFPEMTISVEKLYQGKPQTLRLVLHKPLSDYRWVYWDMQEKAYVPLALPAVGDSIELEGVFAP